MAVLALVGVLGLLSLANAAAQVPNAAATAPAPQASAPAALVAELARLKYATRIQPDANISQWEPLLKELSAWPVLQVEALVTLGYAQATVADPAAVERTSLRLRTLAQGLSAEMAPWARAGADAVTAEMLRRQGPVGRAIRLLGDAVAGLPPEGPAALRMQLISRLARLKDQGGQHGDAVRLYQESILLAAEAGAPSWRHVELRSSLAYNLLQAGQVERARQANQQALELAQKSADDLSLAVAYTTQGLILTAPEDAAAMEQVMRAALTHAQRANAERDEVLYTANLADLFLRRGEYPTALSFAQRALPLAQRLHDRDAESVAQANIGLALVMMGRKDEGLRHARAAVAIDEQTGALPSLVATHSEFGDYLERAGFLDDAYRARREQRRLQTQLFQKDQQRAVIELQESFDHAQRQRDLALLERDGRIQQTQLTNRRLQQWLWAAGAAISLALAGLGVLLLRRVRAGNAQLALTNAQLSELSERDTLTGLANRRHFQAALRQRGVHDALEGTLMLIDIDHFKQINDRFGHAVGDAVLVEVARGLRIALREDDLIVRWGGEEFLILTRAAQRDSVDHLVERLLHAVAEVEVVHGGLRVPVSASIGFASFPLEPALLPLRPEQAVDLVDSAMYLAKAHGRHRAYGVRRASAGDTDALMLLVRDLDAARRAGQVELSAVIGPTPTPMVEGVQ